MCVCIYTYIHTCTHTYTYLRVCVSEQNIYLCAHKYISLV